MPAVASSTGSGVLALAHLELVAALLAAAAAACILIDAVNPGGQLRNAHVKAVHDLRNIQNHMVNEWRVGSLKGRPGKELAAELLEAGEAERLKVEEALKAAESSFGQGAGGS